MVIMQNNPKKLFYKSNTKPFTVSSTSRNSTAATMLRCSYSKTEKAITVSSETERCPVTWHNETSNNHKQNMRVDFNVCYLTPSPKTKVLNWMNDTSNKKKIINEVESVESTTLPFTEAHLDSLTSGSLGSFYSDVNKKSSILVRQDYKKLNIQENICINNGLNRSKSTERNLILIKNNVNNLFRAKSSDRSIEINKNKSNNETEKNIENVKLKRKFSNDEIPLSPKSQQKNELCSYLQLMNMNPSSTKQGSLTQNRRSTRVKNYILLSEKKNLEKKLKIEGTSKEPTDDTANCKSLEHDLQSDDKPNDDSIFTTLLSKCIPETEDNFDQDMIKFLNNEKIKVNNKKNVELKKNGCINNKKTTKTGKENLNNKINKTKEKKKQLNTKIKKKKSKRILNTNSTIVRNLNLKQQKMLRSTGKLKHVGMKVILRKNSKHKENTCKRQLKKRKLKYKIINKTNATKEKPLTENNNSNCDLTILTNIPEDDKINNKKLNGTNNINSSPSFYGFDNYEILNTGAKNLDGICMNLFNCIFAGPKLPKTSITEMNEQKEISTVTNNETSITLPDSNTPETDHDYIKQIHHEEEEHNETEIIYEQPEVFNINLVSSTNCEYLPLNTTVEVKSLHRNLTQVKRKNHINNLDISNDCSSQNWDSDGPKLQKIERYHDHSIYVSDRKGAIINVSYIDYNLIVAQELLVSFWSQSALGNVLGAQNMWIPKGSVHRLVLDSGCVHRKSKETVISLDNSVAYIELWTKEHKSDKRERPVSDVFATIYFCRHRQTNPDMKVLQLENIKGFADDVQYVVLSNSRNIIVSWSGFNDEVKTTIIHLYSIAADYQTVASIKEIESINHYISSLHNIEDCDNLITGFGENKITLWNIHYGHVVATVDLLEVSKPPRTLWVKCDRGFLFTLQLFDDENIRLIVINGINHSWKRIQTYEPPQDFKSLRGVCIENGILTAFYDNGILCWKIQTGELIIEEMCSDVNFMPTGKYVAMKINEKVLVKHVLSYLITDND